MNKNAITIKRMLGLIMNDTEDNIKDVSAAVNVMGRIELCKAAKATDEYIIRLRMPDYYLSIRFESYKIIEDDDDTLVIFHDRNGCAGSLALYRDTKLGAVRA